MEIENYEKIKNTFEREVYKDTYNRFRLNYDKEHYNYNNFPFNSMEEARIILIHAGKFHNNKFIEDATEYLYKHQFDFQKTNKYESEEYWEKVSSLDLLELEEGEYMRVQKEIEDNNNIPIYIDKVGNEEILSVSVSYVAYDDYPGQYSHIDVGRINKKDIDKIKDYVIKKYVSYNLLHGGYNYSISISPYKEPELLTF